MSWGEEPYIVKEAIPFIAVFASLALLAAASRFGSLFWVLLLATLCVTAFFRNPHRSVTRGSESDRVPRRRKDPGCGESFRRPA